MFKDAIDQMKDDEYIEKLHRQISGLKSDIEMVDQQNLSIMKTAEKHKRKSDRLEQQNKRYREALEFYADEGTYEVAETLPPTDEYQQPIEPVFKTVPIIYYDKGKEARKALEGEE